MSALSSYLKYVRNEKGLTVRGFAELIGVDPSSLSRLERGEVAFPSNELLTKIATSLGRSEAEVYLAAGRVSPDLAARLEREMPMAILQIGRILESLATDPAEYAMPEEYDAEWMPSPKDEAISELQDQGFREVAQLADTASRGVITTEQLENVLEGIRRIRLALAATRPPEKP